MFAVAYRNTMANARPKMRVENEVVVRDIAQIRGEKRREHEAEAIRISIARSRAEAKAVREARRREILERIERTMKRYKDDKMPIGERVPIREILRVLCDFHGVSVEELMSRRRQRFLVQIRHEAIRAVADARPDMSLPEIGRVFDNRDHTTILCSLRTTAKPGCDYRGRTLDPLPGRSALDRGERG